MEKVDSLAEQLSNQSLKNEFQVLTKRILDAASEDSTIKERLLQEQVCFEEVHACCVDATNFFYLRHFFDITVIDRFEAAFEKI